MDNSVDKSVDNFFGTYDVILSDDENISDKVVRLKLFKEHGADAVTWESASVAKVCKAHNIPFHSFRFITDVGNESDLMAEFKKGLEKHLNNSAKAFYSLITS